LVVPFELYDAVGTLRVILEGLGLEDCPGVTGRAGAVIEGFKYEGAFCGSTEGNSQCVWGRFGREGGGHLCELEESTRKEWRKESKKQVAVRCSEGGFMQVGHEGREGQGAFIGLFSAYKVGCDVSMDAGMQAHLALPPPFGSLS
jgi:hypothetical protein